MDSPKEAIKLTVRGHKQVLGVILFSFMLGVSSCCRICYVTSITLEHAMNGSREKSVDQQ